MKKIALFVVTLPAFTGIAASAEQTDALIGQWVSPDGQAKQIIERQLDGTWLSTRMWFQSENGWKLVSTGALYRKPDVKHWIGVTRTLDMDGIELFESTLLPAGDGQLDVHNFAFTSEGSVIETEEEWKFDGADRYNYTVFKVSGTDRTPWLKGSWVRMEE